MQSYRNDGRGVPADPALLRGVEMWGKVMNGVALIAAMISACCLDSAQWWKFLIVFVASMGWLIGAAFVNGYFVE